MKKIVSLLLAALMLCGMVSVPAMADGAAKEIEVWIWDRGDADLANMEFYKEIEERTGVHANITSINKDVWTTKLNLGFASELPDVILGAGGGKLDMEMYGVDQGAIIPLDELIETSMPNYKARLDADRSVEKILRASDGSMYYTGWIVPQNINVYGHLFVRQDWLKNLGIDTPTTLEEYEAMLYAIRDNDANGDGDPANEIPFTGTVGSSNQNLYYLMSFWGIPWNKYWVNITPENVVSSQLKNENLRAALETMHKWYADGLIDVEAVAQDYSTWEAKLKNNVVGSIFEWRMIAMGYDDSLINGYECILPVSANGITPQLPVYMEIPIQGAMITAECDDIEAACAWIDAQYDVETQFNGYNGPYGTLEDGTVVGWTRNDNGKIVFYSTSKDIPNQSALHYFSGDEYFSLVDMPAQRVEKTEYCKTYTAAGVVEPYASLTLVNLCKLTLDETERVNLLQADIQKYADEAIIDFICHGVTDESWSNYLSRLESLKIDEYIGIYQDAYSRYLSVQ